MSGTPDAVEQQLALLAQVLHRVGGERLELDGEPRPGVAPSPPRPTSASWRRPVATSRSPDAAPSPSSMRDRLRRRASAS